MNKTLLFLTVLVIATCGLIYELIVGTLASYLLGDSITQFSTVIGGYLFAMGIGSYLSRFVERGVAQRFVEIELAVALFGGLCAPMLFLTFTLTSVFPVVLYGTVLLIGTLVGLEIPLLLRILQDQLKFKDLVSQVLTFDYLGALAASVAFPLLLVPKLGLVRTSLLFGLLNAAVGLWSTWLLAPVLANPLRLRIKAVLLCMGLLVCFAMGDRLNTFYEDQLYADEVVHASSSPYQRIIVTRGKRGFSLFLNGNLQFASIDEYRYHEPLVHPAMGRARKVEHVLILGGGDGLAAREVLRYPEVKSVTLVDLDPAITQLATGYKELAVLNGHALTHPKVRVINTDAMQFLTEGTGTWDVVVVDFPDPNNFALGKLYTTGFYKILKKRLAPDGVAVIQSTSPLFARRSFWCVETTLKAAGFWTQPYHALVPSFGEWGYVMVALEPPGRHRPLPEGLLFLDEHTLEALTRFPPDMAPLPAEVNRLNNQVLVHYYEEEWRRWN
ncbi:polyamine aminopropyltransferase [Corallococcus sp. ZKHCc1 1396]|uniref:Polyamine aminopropyltransferase n=1 Tax=Corallococcus soli TaxID=2710757 RepID=A0ABR9PHX0_9BACT|nr:MULTISPECIES: polyamine aminopropyltransferase [Corallococcus]MBE4747522.1 polyamine aminopropyltransferase [Corallococcus soli]MCY1031754.1 polyamine aminopropyltransferase [Corallococcus sp. BB11-1]